MKRTHDVAIIGGGVTGTALLYELSHAFPHLDIVLLERGPDVGMENSDPLNNAQTSHDGGTETNYSLKHALEVKKAAMLLREYLKLHTGVAGLWQKTNRMVLGVGEREVALLKERYHLFKAHYPDLRLAEVDELLDIEPYVVYNRSEDVSIVGLVSTEGYAVNYQMLSRCFVQDALLRNPGLDLRFNTTVKNARKEEGLFVLDTTGGDIRAKVLVCAAGPYSLMYAQKLGLGQELALLNISGDFWSAPQVLKGKVYTVQQEGLPFAAVHGDPDVVLTHETRFGPTTKPVFLMRRRDFATFIDYMRVSLLSLRGLWVLAKILANRKLLAYVGLNFLYDLPVVGKWLFLREVRKVVPSMRYSDIKLRRGVGGVRPQIVNLTSGKLEMGDKTIVGERCIFNTTPSPGASVCRLNARRDTARIAGFLGLPYADHLDCAAA